MDDGQNETPGHGGVAARGYGGRAGPSGGGRDVAAPLGRQDWKMAVSVATLRQTTVGGRANADARMQATGLADARSLTLWFWRDISPCLPLFSPL